MEFSRNIKVNFRWWNDDETEIPPEHYEILEEHAENRIFEQYQTCRNTSGELILEIDDKEYAGWWFISYVEDYDAKILELETELANLKTENQKLRIAVTFGNSIF